MNQRGRSYNPPKYAISFRESRKVDMDILVNLQAFPATADAAGFSAAARKLDEIGRAHV